MRQGGWKKVKRYYRLNNQIAARELRVLDSEGKQVGILPVDQALKRAAASGLDLVEIAPDAKPPVAKIVDFKKFKYLEKRKEKAARKHTKHTELKEVRFSPFIGEHDFNTALAKAKKFLAEGDLVKISIRFKGRQMAHTEFGPKLLSKILENLTGIAEQERQEKFEGRQFVTVLRPTKLAQKLKEKEEPNEIKNEEGGSQKVQDNPQRENPAQTPDGQPS